MDIALGVTTCERRVNYLPAMLQSLKGAGFKKPLVVNDKHRQGPYRNFKRAVVKLLARHPDAEAIAVFQDDIQIARGARDWLDQNLWPENHEAIGIVSIYCAATHQWQREPGWFKLPLSPNESDLSHEDLRAFVAQTLHERGVMFPDSGLCSVDEIRFVHEYEDRQIFCAHFPNTATLAGIRHEHWRWYWFQQWEDGAGNFQRSDVTEMQQWSMAYGACAFIMPRASAELIVERCTHPESPRKTDIHVAETCYRNGLSFWMHTPSLVQHIGESSTGGGKWGLTRARMADDFCEDIGQLKAGVACA